MPNEAKIIFGVLGGGVLGALVAIGIMLYLFKPDTETAPLDQVNRLETLAELQDFEQLEERYLEEKEAKELYENARDNWLAAYPPVTRLFDREMIHNTDYVVQYLKENPISGDCPLVWRSDVVCVEFSYSGRNVDTISFPTERP